MQVPADPPPAPVPPPSPPPPAWLRVLSVALKLAVIGLIGLVAWQLIASYRSVLPNGGGAAAPSLPPAPPSPSRASPDWLLESGGWSLGDTPWRVTRTTLTAGERDARLAAPGDPPPPRDPHPLESAVIGWVKQTDPTPVRDGAVTRYNMTVNRTTFRGVVEATPTGPRLRLGQVAWPGPAGRWEVLELVPLSGAAGKSDEPLMPPPAGAAVVARRWAGDRVAAELVGPIPNGADPAAGWRSAGWTAASADAASPLQATRWARGDDARVVVRLPAPPGAPSREHLLIFLPLADSRPEPDR